MKYAVENGIIDLIDVQEKVSNMERDMILANHPYDIWQGKDGKWYTHLLDSQNGRRLLRKRNSEKEIEDLIINFYLPSAEPKKANKNNKKDFTFRELYPLWLEHKKLRCDSNGTCATIRRIGVDWNAYYLKDDEHMIDIPLTKLSKEFLDDWVHKKIRKYDMTKKKYYNMSLILRQGLEYATGRYITTNPFEKIAIESKMFRTVKKKADHTQVFLTNEQPLIIENLYKQFEDTGNPISLGVILDFEIGVRVGELSSLKESDIEGNYIHIQRQQVRNYITEDGVNYKQKGYKVVEHTKSDAGDRYVYLNKNARELIAQILQEKKKSKNKSEYLFYYQNKLFSPISFVKRIERACNDIGIPEKRMHKVRKTYVSALIDGGLNINTVREMAGHADERTTYGNYCFNRRTSIETEEMIELALSGGNNILNNYSKIEEPAVAIQEENTKVIKVNQKVINFPANEKPTNPVKSRVCGHSTKSR